ncbi:MAG: alpha/beta hydrolase [Bacillota bacterium]
MRKWISDRIDDAMLPLLKLFAPGYRRRLPPYRPTAELPRHALTPLAQSLRPVELRLAAEPPWRGFKSERFTFVSPFEGGPEHNRLVRGRLLHAGHEAPWAVVVPGYATGATPPHNYGPFQERQGWALLRCGVSVALIDLPYHLSRRAPGRASGEGFFSPDLQATQEAVLQSALDLIALIRWLRRHTGRPVALWGISLGGCIAGLAASQVAELSGLLLMEPLDNPGDIMASLPATREIREVLAAHGVESSGLHRFFAGVAPSSYQPAVARERILFVTADWDRVVRAEFQEAFWERWGRPARIRRPAGHVLLITDRAVNEQAAEVLAGWLRQAPA